MALQSTTAIATITLQQASSIVTFSGIPNTYRDLILLISGTATASGGMYVYFNGDTTASNYSRVVVYGDGSSPASGSSSDSKFMDMYTSQNVMNLTVHDYSATDKHKSILYRGDAAAAITGATAGRWANTAAVNTITIQNVTGSMGVGAVLSLYGRIA